VQKRQASSSGGQGVAGSNPVVPTVQVRAASAHDTALTCVNSYRDRSLFDHCSSLVDGGMTPTGANLEHGAPGAPNGGQSLLQNLSDVERSSGRLATVRRRWPEVLSRSSGGVGRPEHVVKGSGRGLGQESSGQASTGQLRRARLKADPQTTTSPPAQSSIAAGRPGVRGCRVPELGYGV
jgi:hypothetical protein